ncbi:MAG TPA: hypothetical protein GX701_08360 [Clostridiales bacterium]|nr:hypothetical protein [Clostridiales bacterium]
MHFIVSAGNHTRVNTPVSFTVPAAELRALIDTGEAAILPEGGRPLPATCYFQGDTAEVCFVLPLLPAGEELNITVARATSPGTAQSRQTDRGVSVYLDGRQFAEYYTKTDLAKPYFGPFYDQFGTQVTRLDFETKEHPHHRSLWISHGDVNGVDTWNEPKGKNGFIRNKKLYDFVNGGAYTAFTAENQWTTHEGEPLLDETTRYKVYQMPDAASLFDVEITLTAAYDDVTLGATKEAGPLAIRMAENLKVQNTGTMVSGHGGINEDEIWMKRAPFVDYYGTENGHVCGIAVLDHPSNEGFPTYWHARNYGLMAVNNFYVPGPRKLAKGEQMSWRFRIVVHSGDTKTADIAGRFTDFAFPPKVTSSAL